MMRLKGEQLDEQFRLTPRPVVLLYRVTIHDDVERAEQMNL